MKRQGSENTRTAHKKHRTDEDFYNDKELEFVGNKLMDLDLKRVPPSSKQTGDDWYAILDRKGGFRNLEIRYIRKFSSHGGHDICFNSNGSLIAVRHCTDILVYSVESGVFLGEVGFSPQDGVIGVCFGPKDETLITGIASGCVEVWDYTRPTLLMSRKLYPDGDIKLKAIAFNGHLVAAAYQTTTRGESVEDSNRYRIEVIEHDGMHFLPPQKITDQLKEPTSIAISPDGRHLAVGYMSGTLQLWEIWPPYRLCGRGDRHSPCFRIAYTTNEVILSCSGDSTVRLWTYSWTSGLEECTLVRKRDLDGHRASVRTLAHEPHFSWVLSGGDEGEIMFWDLDNGTADACLVGHKGPIHGVAISPKAGDFATCSEDGTVKIWRYATLDAVITLGGTS